MSKRRRKAYIFLISVAVLWGAAPPIIKFTLDGIDPFPFLSYRFFIAAVFSLIYFAYKGKNIIKLIKKSPMILLYGFMAVPLALGILFTGLDKSSVLDLTLIGVLGPLVVTTGGAMFFHDRITHRERVGIGIVLAGAVINSFAPLFLNGNDGVRLSGNLLLLLFLIVDSSSVLVAKKAVQKKIQSIDLTNIAFIIGALTIIPYTAVTYGAENLVNSITNLSLAHHLGVWYMALLSGSLAYYLYVRGQKSIEVSEATLFNYLQPIFTVPLAIFWLGERLTSTFMFGATLIIIGLVIAEYKKKRNIKSK